MIKYEELKTLSSNHPRLVAGKKIRNIVGP
jgi:hypothetical protein